MSIKHFRLFVFLFFAACGPARDITYFSNLQGNKVTSEDITNDIDPTIQHDDLLSISVSSLNPEANVLFNSGVMQAVGTGSGIATAGKAEEGYIVSKSGNINFPVLGNVKLAGLTKEQAINKMTSEIKNHVKNPIVNIRFVNFRITVLGEVGRPSSFIVPTERINILEALALAGDITSLGKKDNVLLIREKDGVRTTTRTNLNDKGALSSSNFYLQQNDIVYVEASKIKKLQGSSSTFYLQILSAGLAIISLLVIFARP